MPLPKNMARFSNLVTNPLVARVADRMPGLALVNHVGRRSGRRYHTPVNLYRNGDRYVIALLYGADSHWVRNVLAAGTCEVRTRGRRLELTEPRIVHDTRQALVPAAIRPIMRAVNVQDFMLLSSGSSHDSR